MKRLAWLAPALAASLACASCATPSTATADTTAAGKVLFVGNSQLYVGNAPAVFAALASANGHPVDSDMIVEGGATLSDRVADGSVGRALADGGYTALVLQERGGDLICVYGPESCAQSREAVATLATLAREHGVRAMLLGTYQSLPEASRALVEAEAAAAAAAGIPYLQSSETFRRLRTAAPALEWLDPDGAHPGKALTLLDAMLVYRALHGELPEVKPLVVRAPIYQARSGLRALLRPAGAPPPRSDTPRRVSYEAETIETIAGAMEADLYSKP